MANITEVEYLRSSLKSIAALWPEGNGADVLAVSGINDGKSRAILLEAALNIARAALAEKF